MSNFFATLIEGITTLVLALRALTFLNSIIIPANTQIKDTK